MGVFGVTLTRAQTMKKKRRHAGALQKTSALNHALRSNQPSHARGDEA